ncbi:hypothetical protein D3C84_866980 [compost metagenome]
MVGVDFVQLWCRGDHHPAQLGVIEQGLQQVAGADLPLAEFDRGQHPGLFDHPGDVWRQCRCAGIALLEGAQRRHQLRLQALGNHIVVAQDGRQVVVVAVEQLQQQVLDLDVVMMLRQAQGRRAFSGRAAGFIQLGEQGLQVHRATPSKGIWKTAQREGSTSAPGRLSQPCQPNETLPPRPRRAAGTASALSRGAIWKSSSAPT